jgi:hypothetical protein
MHSEMGRVIPSANLDGFEPFFDPLNPISVSHIEAAARKCRVEPEAIGDTITSLSSYCGWDVMRGLKPSDDGGEASERS